MKKISPQSSKQWLGRAAAGLASFAGGERLAAVPWVDVSGLPLRRAAPLDHYAGGYEHVLGTSLDVIVQAARPRDALECETRVLGEIERLRRICSTYDSSSEISRVMAGGPVVSSELVELFAAYADWSARTGGLIELNLGGVIDAWRAAAISGRAPDREGLERAARKERAFNVDALGKAFIIDRAVAVAQRYASGGLLNLGGDIRVWGDTAWTIAVADPRNPADNAPPLMRFELRDAAVATSGSYARFFAVGGKRFSHLIDPRTYWPLAVGGGSTVVARDSVTANALSTAASVGGVRTGAELARAEGAAGYIFAESTGHVTAGGLFASPLAAAAAPSASASAPAPSPAAPPVAAASAPGGSGSPAPAPAPVTGFPAGFQVSVPVTLKTHTGARQIYRPYVVVWIENAKREIVRTVAVWGEDSRWQRKLSVWERRLSDTTNIDPARVARATRAPGSYTVTWNGKDDFGVRVPAGVYKICLEICREDGNHVVEAIELNCETEPVTGTFRDTLESAASTISYGPAPAPTTPSSKS